VKENKKQSRVDILHDFLVHVQMFTGYAVSQIASLQKIYFLPLHQSKKFAISDDKDMDRHNNYSAAHLW
jgi:hypothetical protein